MKSTSLFRALVLLACLIGVSVPAGAMAGSPMQQDAPATAQTSAKAHAKKMAPMMTKADRADIRQFTLNEDVLGRLQAAIAEGRHMKVEQVRINVSSAHSLKGIARHMTDANAHLAGMLKKHGFTPRQFLVADLAAVVAVKKAHHPDAKPGQEVGSAGAAKGKSKGKLSNTDKRRQWWMGLVNPANVAFYAAHKRAMDALFDASGALPE